MADICLSAAGSTWIIRQSFNRYNIFTASINTNPQDEQREKDNRVVGQKLNYFCEPMYSYN